MFSISLLVSKNSDAQIYKWVDSNGVTHYSEKKENVPTSKVDQLNIKSRPTESKDTSERYWEEQDLKFKQRQAENSAKQGSAPPLPEKQPESLSGGRSDDTAASKCNLAKDVVNGTVKHPNGAPIDKYDLDTAKNDIRTFCR
jgi:hypothetical protein